MMQQRLKTRVWVKNFIYKGDKSHKSYKITKRVMSSSLATKFQKTVFFSAWIFFFPLKIWHNNWTTIRKTFEIKSPSPSNLKTPSSPSTFHLHNFHTILVVSNQQNFFHTCRVQMTSTTLHSFKILKP